MSYIADLDQVWDAKPLLDGKAIMNFLQLKTGGPLVKEWVRNTLAITAPLHYLVAS